MSESLLKSSVIRFESGHIVPGQSYTNWVRSTTAPTDLVEPVQIWAAPVSFLDEVPDWVNSALVDEDCAALETLSPVRRAEVRLGRCLLRRALRASGFADIADEPLAYGRHGAPYFASKNEEGPWFSISHANGWVAVSLSSISRVGLDLENLNRQLKVSRLGPRVLSPTEATWLATFDSDLQPHHLLTAWVGKEAVLKALGLGVHGVITSVEVLGHERNPVRTDPQSGERQRWSAVWPLVDQSLIVCLATETAPESIQLIRISASPIT